MLSNKMPSWPSYTEEEIEAVARVLQSNKVNYWTAEECKLFEREFADWTQSRFAVSLANGSIALDLALKGIGINPGDEIIVTPRTFIASVFCIMNVGAIPVFADVDLETQNITAESIEPLITSRTKAIICVHILGWPCDMDSILELAQRHGLKVVEDCAQAHGAMYKGKPVGTLGDVAAWSFCQDKIMTTGGEGGMVTTNNESTWSTIWSLKDHGKSMEAVNNNTSNGFSWVHESVGGNGRMTEMQAVIGRIQLQRMDEWHSRRKANAERLIETLSASPVLRVPRPPTDLEHAWYKFTVFTRPENLAPGWDRERIMNEINGRGVACRVGPCPEVYLEKVFDNTGFRPDKRLKNAQELGDTSLMFFVHPTLGENEIQSMVEIIMEVLMDAEL